MKLFILILMIFAQSTTQAGLKCESLFKDALLKKNETVQLFQNEQPVQDYVLRIKNLKPGDKIDFGHGRIFTFYKELSDPRRGDLTTIIDIGHDKILRIAKHYSYTSTRTPKLMAKDMSDWFSVMHELEKNGVPVVKTYREESRPPQFIVVRKENFIFRLSDLFMNGKLNLDKPELINIHPDIIQEALNKLIVFAGQTWMYQSIGDFRYEQMGYNGKEWLLFDAGIQDHALLNNFDQTSHTFSSPSEDPYSGAHLGKGNFLPKKIRKKIDMIIEENRKQANLHKQWITREPYTGQAGFHNYLLRGITKEPLTEGLSFKVKSGNPQINKDGRSEMFADWWVESTVSFKIVSLIEIKKSYSYYQVQMNDGSMATFKILRYNSEKDLERNANQVEALKESKELVAYGEDFILFKN